jgi:hypothetical protein
MLNILDLSAGKLRWCPQPILDSCGIYGSADVMVVLIIRSLVGTFYLLGKNIHNRNNTAVSFVASWRISRIVAAADGALVFANC